MEGESYGEHRLDIVYDGKQDIVKNDLLVRFRSGATGRKRNQIIYVRKGPKGKGWTTSKYEPAKDYDKSSRPIPLLLTKAEEEGRSNTVPALVVGLALASEPYKYNPESSGTARNAQLEKERNQLGILDCDTGFLRVVIPQTDYIASQNKYYVVCHQTHDICDVRLANQHFVFYYDEFWTGIETTSNVKSRRVELGKACRTAAAIHKQSEDRAQISVQTDPASNEGWTASSLLSVSPASNLARTLALQFSLYAINPQASILSAARATIEDSLPDIRNTPYGTSNVGTVSFYDFEEILSQENAVNVVRELQALDSTIYKDLDADMIVKIHSTLRENNLGGHLTYQGFGIFLEACHRKCKSGWDSSLILATVKSILEDHQQIIAAGFGSTPSKSQPGLPADGDSFRVWLESFRELLVSHNQYLKRYAQKMQQQHGALDTSTTFEKLMERVGNCVDRTAFMALFEQGMALHAQQWASAHMKAYDYGEELVRHMNKALGREDI